MQQKTPTGVVTSLALVVLVIQPCWADGSSQMHISTGFDATTGTYGSATTTTIRSVPTSLSYDAGPVTVKVTVPYVRITGSDNVIAGLGPVGTKATQSSSASGWGDVITGASYSVYNDAASQTGIDLTGKIKFGTANRDKGLGTGKADFSTQVDGYRKFGNWTAFGAVGYAWLGSSDAIPLKNVVNGSAGASYQLSDADTAGFSVDYRQKASALGFAQRELTGFISHKVGKDWKAQIYGLKGFSDGSADWGGGASVAYTF